MLLPDGGISQVDPVDGVASAGRAKSEASFRGPVRNSGILGTPYLTPCFEWLGAAFSQSQSTAEQSLEALGSGPLSAADEPHKRAEGRNRSEAKARLHARLCHRPAPCRSVIVSPAADLGRHAIDPRVARRLGHHLDRVDVELSMVSPESPTCIPASYGTSPGPIVLGSIGV
jgi:hypothetical protein